MAAFLVRAFNYTNPGVVDYFNDDNNSVFEAAINKLRTAGVTQGCNPPANNHYCPNEQRHPRTNGLIPQTSHYRVTTCDSPT